MVGNENYNQKWRKKVEQQQMSIKLVSVALSYSCNLCQAFLAALVLRYEIWRKKQLD